MTLRRSVLCSKSEYELMLDDAGVDDVRMRGLRNA